MTPPSTRFDPANIKALTFDVFGTVADWRSSVEAELTRALKRKLSSPFFSALPPSSQSHVIEIAGPHSRNGGGISAWAARLATAWRASYGVFTRTFEPGVTPWQDIDTHHRSSLESLLTRDGLDGLFSPEELDELSLVWHRLRPWPDVVEALRMLGTRFETAMLSNGNRELLEDLERQDWEVDEDEDHNNQSSSDSSRGSKHPHLGFCRILSAADYGAYKPHSSVYLGACAALGSLNGSNGGPAGPDQVAMVAAHLDDLAGARAVGMRTVYVARPGEDAQTGVWAPGGDRYEEAKRWVDVWVGLGAGGFLELARLLGCGSGIESTSESRDRDTA